MDSIDAKFDTKLGIAQAENLFENKLDSEKFLAVFPANRTIDETFKQHIKVNSEAFRENVVNMIKLWD